MNKDDVGSELRNLVMHGCIGISCKDCILNDPDLEDLCYMIDTEGL